MAAGDYIEAKLVSFSETEVTSWATDIEQIWARSAKAERERILNRLLSVFSDAQTFEDIMLKRQLKAYENYINPNHPKAQKALLKLQLKWKDDKTYQKWNTNVQSAFAEGGAFENGVDAVDANDIYANRVKPVLQIVGVHGYKIGPAPKLLMLLQGYDITPYLDSDLGETFTDTGVDKPLVKSGIPLYALQPVVPILVEGIRWHKAYLGVGDSTSAANMLSQTEANLKSFIEGLIDTSKFSVASLTISYDSASDRYTIQIHIDQTA